MQKTTKDEIKHRNIANNIFIFILMGLIILSFLLVGSDINYNVIYLNISIIIINIIFVFYILFIKKKKIELKKIELLLFLFCFSTCIPLLSKKYYSLNDTLILIIKTFSAFDFYIIISYEIRTNSKTKWINNVLIFCGVFLFIFGIDEQFSGIIMRILYKANVPAIVNPENRMISSIGYANSFAIIMAILFLISFSNIKIKKEIYSGFSFIFFSGLLLSFSRTTILEFLILLILIFLLKRNKRRIYYFYIFFNIMIVSLFYLKIYEIALEYKRYIPLLLITIILFILTILLSFLIRFYIKKLFKIKRKYYVILLLIITLACFGIASYDLKNDIPLKIFNNNSTSSDVKYKVYNIYGEKEYVLKFNIEAKCLKSNKNNYKIIILEENKYYDRIGEHEINFGNFSGEKEIKITTNKDTIDFAILFESINEDTQNGLQTNSLYINNEKYALNYKILPVKLVKRIENFFLGNKSISERATYDKDGLKIIKNNFLFGCGGNGWKYTYKNYQSYNYYTSEMHNFYLDVFIENGIIGALLFYLIIVYLIINFIIKMKKHKLTIYDYIMLLLNIHIFTEFDMSFYCIIQLWFTIFALINLSSNNEKTIIIKKQLPIIIFIVKIIMTIILFSYYFYIVNYENELQSSKRKNLYNENVKISNLIEYYNMEKDDNKLDLDLGIFNFREISDENIKSLYKIISNQKILVDTELNMERNEIIYKIIRETSNNKYKHLFANIIIEENDSIIKNIENLEINRSTKEEEENYKKRQNEIYETALKIN